MLATTAVGFFFFHTSFYDASIKQASCIEFFHIIYFYQMAHLICRSRFTVVSAIPVHYVEEYFIKSSIWISNRINERTDTQKGSFWFSIAF